MAQITTFTTPDQTATVVPMARCIEPSSPARCTERSVLAAAQHADRGELVSEDRHGGADETAVRSDCAARRGGDHVEDDALDVVDGSIVDSVSACRDGHEPSIGETEADGDEMANELAGCRGRILVEKPDHGAPPQAPLREMHGGRGDETTFVGPAFASHMRRLYGAAADEQVWPGSATAHCGPIGRNDRPGSAIARIDLTDPSEIVEHMARDILAARRDGRHAVLIDLTEFGWTRAQAMRFGSQAHAAALDPRVATQDVVERLAARKGEPLVAVVGVDTARITAAGEAAIAAALAAPVADDIGGDAA